MFSTLFTGPLHSITDKPMALDEFARTMKRGGYLTYTNVTPAEMPHWVYYRFFPTARSNDLDRFWPGDRMESELSSRGFEVTVEIEYRRKARRHSDLLDEFRNRDASQLWTISEEEYQAGLADVVNVLGRNLEDTFDDEMALITLIARKR